MEVASIGVGATGAGGDKATVLVLGAFSAAMLGLHAEEVTVSVAVVAVAIDTAAAVEAAFAAAIVALFTASNTLSSTRSSKSRVSTA